MCADDRQAFGFVKVVVESHEEQWEDAVARRQILGVTRHERHRVCESGGGDFTDSAILLPLYTYSTHTRVTVS